MTPRAIEYPELGLTVLLYADDLAEFVRWEDDEPDDDEGVRGVDPASRMGYIDT